MPDDLLRLHRNCPGAGGAGVGPMAADDMSMAALACLFFAFLLAANDAPGWGWFLFIALIVD